MQIMCVVQAHEQPKPLAEQSQFSGSWNGFAVLGMSRSFHHWSVVGTEGNPAFKVSHAVGSFYLLNVQATAGAKPTPVLYQPYPVQEDLDFNFACEEAGLVVAKCNTLFHVKTNLQALNQLPGGSPAMLSLQVREAVPQRYSSFGGQPIQLCITLPPHLQRKTDQELEEELAPMAFSFAPADSDDAADDMSAQETAVEWLRRDGNEVRVTAAVPFSMELLVSGLQQALLHVQSESTSKAIHHETSAVLKMGMYSANCSIGLASFYAWDVDTEYSWLNSKDAMLKVSAMIWRF